MQSVKLGSGRVLSFDDEEHRYDLDGVRVPGITSLLKKHGLLEEMRFVPEEAKERGSRRHAAIHFDAEGDLNEDSVLEEDWPFIEAARKARLELYLQAVRCESLEGSDLYWYATMIDVVGVSDGKRCVINWKTGSDSKVYAVQLHLEALLLEERPELILCVRLRSDGEFDLTDYRRDRAAAKLAKAIALAQGESMAWKIERKLA